MRLLVLGAVVGAVGGMAAGVFDLTRSALGWLALGAIEPSVTSLSWWRVLVVPVLGGALAGLVVHHGTRGGGPLGMARVVHASQLRDGRVPLRDGISTALAAAIALGTGHSGGREAPVAGLAAALTRVLALRLRLRPADLRVLVAAAAAAGIAASFNTPLGSAVLAFEVILGSFALRHIGPVVAATVVGTLVGQALLGTRVAFHAPVFDLGSPLALLAYAGLGLFCAVVARGLTVLIGLVETRLYPLAVPPVARGAAAGLVVGLLAAAGLHGVTGTGYPLIDHILAEPAALGLPLLVALLLGKVAATAAMWSGRLGPGLFSPTLVIGATTGAIYAVSLGAVLPDGLPSPGSYALVAMGAVAAAVLKAPLAMTLVLFELTGSYAVVPTMLLTVAVSAAVSSLFEPTSLYEAILLRRGVRLHHELPVQLRDHTVGELMRSSDLVTVPQGCALQDVVDAFGRTRDDLVWVLDLDGRLAGAIDVQDVLDAVSHPDPQQASLTQVLAALRPQDPASDALALLQESGLDFAPVVDEDGRLVGVLSERALLSALGQEV